MKRDIEKHRAWRRRSKPITSTGKLSRKATIRRGKRLAPVNSKRAAKRKAECFGPQAQACRETSCCVLNCDAPAECHHEPPRSVGGIDRDCVPLCRQHHQKRHDIGAMSFWAWCGLDVERVKYRMGLIVKGAA